MVVSKLQLNSGKTRYSATLNDISVNDGSTTNGFMVVLGIQTKLYWHAPVKNLEHFRVPMSDCVPYRVIPSPWSLPPLAPIPTKVILTATAIFVTKTCLVVPYCLWLDGSCTGFFSQEVTLWYSWIVLTTWKSSMARSVAPLSRCTRKTPRPKSVAEWNHLFSNQNKHKSNVYVCKSYQHIIENTPVQEVICIERFLGIELLVPQDRTWTSCPNHRWPALYGPWATKSFNKKIVPRVSVFSSNYPHQSYWSA